MEQVEKKRGGFLSGWLIFLTIANSVILLISSPFIFSTFLSRAVFVDILSHAATQYFVSIVLNIIFSRAAWKWKKWGVWGLGVMAVLAAIFSWLSLYLSYLFPIGIVGIVFLIILIRPVWQYFTWK